MLDLNNKVELVEQFLKWLQEQPRGKEFDGNHMKECAFAQFLRTSGAPGCVYHNSFAVSRGIYPIPEELVPHLHDDEANHAKDDGFDPWAPQIKTFGQLYDELMIGTV